VIETAESTPGADPGHRVGRGAPDRARLARVWRGPNAQAAWVRPSVLTLLAGTALLYLCGLGRSGWANEYYSAAAQAGAASWKAWFFGSLDSSNFITVDKTPASLWLMGLSVRVFGLSSWSILVPEALCGVACVAVLYAAVRRVSGPAAGLIAGAVLASTPVATLMFRFNNPDALLVLLLTVGAYAVVRAVETGRTAWIVLAGAAVGFGFLAKMLQALLVVPGFGLAYVVAAPGSVWRRLRSLAVGLVALVGSAGWWVAVVELVPASARPYIGGSTNNSVLQLALGYNGLGRLDGNETGSVGFGGGTGPAFGGAARWNRLFGAEFGGQASWLLPAALIGLAAGLWLTWRASRRSARRAAYLLWGGWLLVTAATFSYMRGIIHSYYLVALAPAIGALVGMAAAGLWERRSSWLARGVLGAMVAVAAGWSAVLLGRSPDWHPWLPRLVLVTGVLAVTMLLCAHWLRRVAVAAAVSLGLVAVLAGPSAYALETASTPHTGALPSAGPAVAGGFGPGGGGPGGGGFAGRGRFGGFPGGGVAGGGANGGGVNGGGVNGGGVNGGGVNGGGVQVGPPGGFGGGGNGGGFGRGGGFGGGGGLVGGGTVDSALVSALRSGGSGYTWAAATVGATSAAPLQLASGLPVLAIGGFNGTDASPTLAQFQALVQAGKIHYFVTGTRGFGGGTGSSSIASWVEQHFTASTVGGATVYDLSGAARTS
jgi:4-amino-4-deoxy-L-arabinose transferase-like glycosyltransferase